MPTVSHPAARRPVHSSAALVAVLIAAAASTLPSAAAGQAWATSLEVFAAGQRTEERARELEDRRERQLRAGLIRDAAATSKQLDDLTRTQVDKCSRWWNQLDAAKAGVVPEDAVRDPKAVLTLGAECQWRPGRTPAASERRTTPRRDDLQVHAQEEFQGATRAPLFIEPTLITMVLDQEDFDRELTPFHDFTATKESSPELGRLWRAVRSSPAQADVAFERMLSILQSSSATKPGAIAYVLDSRSRFAESRGDVSLALAYARSALDLRVQDVGATSPALCPALWQTATLLVSNREADRAIEMASRCLSLVLPRGRSSATYASAVVNLGVIHHRLGAIDRAIDAYLQGLQAIEQLPPTPMIRGMQPTLYVHANLGLAYWQRGDATRAYQHLELARQQMAKEGDPLATEKGIVLGLASLSLELDIFLTVERAARQVPVAGTLALPMLLERKSYGLETKAAAVKALAATPDRLAEYRALLAHRAALARAQPADADARAIQLQLARELEQQILTIESVAHKPEWNAAFISQRRADPRAAEYGKALGDAMQRRMTEYDKRPPNDDGRSEEEILQQISQQAFAEVEVRFKDFLAAEQQRARGGRETLLPRIQQALPDTAALLEMVRFRPFRASRTEAERWEPARYGTYVVRRTGTPAFIDFGDASAIDELVVEFRRALSAPRGTLARDLGRRLDVALMHPVRAHLGAATQVLVSPDGLLNLVPFAAMVDADDHYLIESFTFTYLSSGRDLLRETTAGRPRPTPAVVIADPAFDGGPEPLVSAAPLRSALGTRFDPLPGTAGEAQAIKRLLPEATVFTGERATETALKTLAAPRILHVATHGFFLEDQDLARPPTASVPEVEDPMLRSGLVFAGVNAGRSGDDDGVLTALEAAALGLAGTELVVLSACDTAVGDVKTGEGVFGLRRAFMAAGAETLVMSLWRVDDEATRQLMTEYYQRLTRGEGRAEALRQASLTLLRDPMRRNPFYWASFISSGQTGRMRR